MCEALSRSPAQRQSEMMNNLLKTRRPTCERTTNRALQPFGVNLLAAIGEDTAEAAGADGRHHTTSLRWKIGQCSQIAAVDAGGFCPTEWAGGGHAEGACANPQSIGLGLETLNGKPARSKRDSTTHGGDPLPIRRP